MLSTLFPASASTKRPLKFDPEDECIASSYHRRKKSATPEKVRSKKVKVVMLDVVLPNIPTGSHRQSLLKHNQILEISFRRCMTTKEVKKMICDNFKHLGHVHFQFMHAKQDHILITSEVQQLHGAAVIKLAGSGTLYLLQEEKSIDEVSCDHPSTSSSISSQPISQVLHRA